MLNKAIEIGFAVDNTPSVHIVEKPFLRLVGQGVGQQIFVLHQNFHLLLHRFIFFCTACLRINISVIEFFNAIAFDPYTHGYYKVIERVGEAFRDGLKLKK